MSEYSDVKETTAQAEASLLSSKYINLQINPYLIESVGRQLHDHHAHALLAPIQIMCQLSISSI